MLARPGQDPKSVFLNFPYDDEYQPFFVTLVATLVLLGQTPRCVLEVQETGAGRLARIFDLLRSCGVSIHDLCRVGTPVRFNMPFELGMACTLALGGEPHDIVVLDRKRYPRTWRIARPVGARGGEGCIVAQPGGLGF